MIFRTISSRFIPILILGTLFFTPGCSSGSPEKLYSSPEQYQVLRQKRAHAKGKEDPLFTQARVAMKNKAEDDKISRIALLVPLSGASADIGKAMLQAAELALFDIGDPNIFVLPFDTKGTPKGAESAAREAISHNVKLILGPLFSETAEAIAPTAAKHGINVISFSNNKELVKKGIFLLGFMPEQQIRRVVEFSYVQGIQDFSILAPDNTFGDVAIEEVEKTLAKKALRVKAVQRYEGMDAALSSSIREIANAPHGASPANLAQKKFEVLVVPEGGRNLKTIATRIFRHGLDSERFRLVGSGQWDDATILNEPKLYGSWFASSPPDQREIFERHFVNLYGYVPVRIASLAYDGIALSALLAQSNEGESRFGKAAITNRRGFSGVNGVFRFGWDGLPERSLAIMEVTKSGFEVIDPAPKDFNYFSFQSITHPFRQLIDE